MSTEASRECTRRKCVKELTFKIMPPDILDVGVCIDDAFPTDYEKSLLPGVIVLLSDKINRTANILHYGSSK